LATKLSFQIIREDIVPIVEAVTAFEFVSGEKRTLALQILNDYNQKPYLVPVGKTVTACLPTSDTNGPIQKAMIIGALDRSIFTAELSVEDTQRFISGNVTVVVAEDSAAVKATGSITINNNTFDPGDSVSVDGKTFIVNVDWTPGVDADASAVALASAIDAGVGSVSAVAALNIINITANAFGESGNAIALAENDTNTNNFTLSGNILSGGSFGTDVLKAIRKSIFTRNKGE